MARLYGCRISGIVEDNPDRSRFELRVDGELVGWAEYRPAGDSVIVAHTEIDERREGEGLGGVLVSGTRPAIQIDHSEAANDKLTVNGLGGDDDVAIDRNASALIQTLVDLGGDE